MHKGDCYGNVITVVSAVLHTPVPQEIYVLYDN